MRPPHLVFAFLLLGALAASPKLPRLSAQPTAPKPAAAKSAISKAELVGFTKGPWSLPTQGFSLSLPQGWIAEKGGLGHRVLSCALPNKSGAIRQIVLVEVGMSEVATLRGHAETIAEPSQMQILDSSRQLDNKAALVLKLSRPNPGLTKKWAQERAIVARQGKQTFTIGVLADADQKIDATVDALFRGWKWQCFADPTQYLQFRATPASFDAGRLRISLPGIMSPASIEPEMTMLGITDARTGVLAFTLSVAVISAQKSMDLKTMRSNFTAQLRQRLNLQKAIVWQDARSEPPRTLSNFFNLPKELEESGYSAVGSYGLVKMPDNRWAILTFTITGQDSKAQALYSATAQKMFASVKLGISRRH